MALTFEPIINQQSQPAQPTQTFKDERVIDSYKNGANRIEQARQAALSNMSQSGTNVNEQPAAPAAPTDSQSVSLSPEATAQARREQTFRRQQAELKAAQDALVKERAEIAELRDLKTKLQAKDFSGVESQVDYEAYTNYLIEKSAQVSPEQAEIQKLKAEIEAVKKSQSDVQNTRIMASIQAVVDANPALSSIKELKAYGHVKQHIEDTREQDGVELSPEQAAAEVEEALLEAARQWTSLSKLRTAPQQPVPQTPATQVAPRPSAPVKEPPRTITNQMNATGEVKAARPPLDSFPPRERLAEARRRAIEDLEKQRLGIL